MKYVVAVLMLLILIVGCAPVATTPPPTATPPVATPPVAPSTPPVTASVAPEPVTPPPAKVLSFASATYTNDTLGFTWQYPVKWEELGLRSAFTEGEFVISVISYVDRFADYGGVAVVPETADFGQVVKAGFRSFHPWCWLNATVFASPHKAIYLADGKTPANEAIVTGTWEGSDNYCYAVGFSKNGKMIIAWCTTFGNDKQKDLTKEIAQTLSVK